MEINYTHSFLQHGHDKSPKKKNLKKEDFISLMVSGVLTQHGREGDMTEKSKSHRG